MDDAYLVHVSGTPYYVEPRTVWSGLWDLFVSVAAWFCKADAGVRRHLGGRRADL
jgi:hypothetical protein